MSPKKEGKKIRSATSRTGRVSKPFRVALVETGDTARDVPGWVRKVLASQKIDFLEHGCESQEDLAAHASDSDVVWVWGSSVVTDKSLNVLPKCGAILRSGSGTDNVPVAEATKHGVMVINTPGAVAQEVSDHAIAMLLGVVRQITAQDRRMRRGVWEFHRENNRWHLRGSTLGLIGFGHIAQLVAKKIKGFDVKILVHDPWISADRIRARGGEPVDLETLLSKSDFISVHCPLTSKTRHLLGDKQFALMKEHAILINTSRGPIVDEAALTRALQQNRIGGAGLDVFEEEPLAKSSPLLTLENVVLTPHIAGYSDVFPGSFWRYSVESLIGLSRGYWPRSVVNPTVKPKWNLRKRKWPVDPEIPGLKGKESPSIVSTLETDGALRDDTG